MSVPARLGRDDGAVSAMFAVLGFAIFISLALVVHGGRQLGALSEAQDLADNAARAGSQKIDLDTWRATGRPVIDRAEAEAEVNLFLAPYVASGRIDPPIVVDLGGPDADITVTVEVTVRPTSFFFPPSTATATESATALDGVTG